MIEFVAQWPKVPYLRLSVLFSGAEALIADGRWETTERHRRPLCEEDEEEVGGDEANKATGRDVRRRRPAPVVRPVSHGRRRAGPGLEVGDDAGGRTRATRSAQRPREGHEQRSRQRAAPRQGERRRQTVPTTTMARTSHGETRRRRVRPGWPADAESEAVRARRHGQARTTSTSRTPCEP